MKTKTLAQSTHHELLPWQDPPIPWYIRAASFTGILCLGVLIFWSALNLAIAVATGALAAPGIGDIFKHLLLPVAGIVIGIAGWKWIRLYAFGHNDFRSWLAYPANLLGLPIAIKMSHPVQGWGTVLFTPDGLKIQASAPTISTLNVFDLIRDIIFQLAGVLVRTLLGKQKAEYTLTYSQMTEVNVTRRRVVIHSPDEKVKTTKFEVSSADGERLYQELNAHFPRAIDAWRHLLKNR